MTRRLETRAHSRACASMRPDAGLLPVPWQLGFLRREAAGKLGIRAIEAWRPAGASAGPPGGGREKGRGVVNVEAAPPSGIRKKNPVYPIDVIDSEFAS